MGSVSARVFVAVCGVRRWLFTVVRSPKNSQPPSKGVRSHRTACVSVSFPSFTIPIVLSFCLWLGADQGSVDGAVRGGSSDCYGSWLCFFCRRLLLFCCVSLARA
jgi:hypothetical protein